MGLLTTIRAEIDALLGINAENGDYEGTVRAKFPALDLRWPSGTAASQADRLITDYGVTLADGATRNLDLRSIANALGGTTTFVEVRALGIRLRDKPLTVAKGGSNGWTGLGASWTITPPIGTWILLVNAEDGRLPTTASDKVIDITNNSGDVATYDLLLIGTSA